MTRWIASALVLVAGGCVFLVSAEPGGEHCRFANEGSTCGSCVQAHCQAEVDGACRSGRDGVLAELDGCITKRDATCSALFQEASSTEGSDLGACVRKACPGACAPAPPTSETRCTPEPLGDGRPCACSLSASANNFVCSEAAMPRTICCAPQGWPAPGLSCSCQPLGCTPNNTGCSCFLTPYGVESDVCEGEHCCATLDSCSCGARLCRGNEHAVDRCSLDQINCAQEQQRVPTCSLPP